MSVFSSVLDYVNYKKQDIKPSTSSITLQVVSYDGRLNNIQCLNKVSKIDKIQQICSKNHSSSATMNYIKQQKYRKQKPIIKKILHKDKLRGLSYVNRNSISKMNRHTHQMFQRYLENFVK